MLIQWVEAVQQQCQKNGVLFFFKQWGGVRKHRNGRELHGRTYDDMPQRPLNLRFSSTIP
jgi:protein gp37